MHGPDSGGGLTNFEYMSAAEMHSMVSGADPQVLLDRSEALSKALGHIDDVRSALVKHMGSVEWQGEGGDAFQSWGQQLTDTTTQLYDYTEAVSYSMNHAGTTLREVQKALPPPPDGVQVHLDPSSVEAARQETIPQMTKLAGAYQMATDHMARQPTPVFEPMPQAMVPSTSRGEHQQQILDPSVGTGYRQASTQPGITRSGHEEPVPGRPTPEQRGRTSLDSLPGASSTLTPEPLHPHPESTASTTPVDLLPGSPHPMFPSGPRAVGGAEGRPSYGELPTIPSAGRAGVPSPKVVTGDEGIFGGSASKPAVSPARPASRGLVVGEEGQPGMRSPMSGYGGGMGSGGGSLSRQGEMSRRRLANQPGGEAGVPDADGVSSSDYTPGGAGLRRSAAENEGAESNRSVTGPGAGSGIGTDRDGRRGRPARPGYLVEDEDAWLAGGRGTVPPVIG